VKYALGIALNGDKAISDRGTMAIRERLRSNTLLGVGISVGLLLVAAMALAIQYWPQKKANLNLRYYTDDDGQTWFSDDISHVAPYDHDGKTAVMAEIFSYDNGSKKFCAYEEKYTSKAKEQIDNAIAHARAKGEPVNEVPLLRDPFFKRANLLVKLPGINNPWLAYSDPRANQVFSIHSPDGSVVDEVFVY
jgi:hypothetical protein